MFDNVMTVGFSATFEILIAVALELVIGKFLFFDPVRWLKAGLNRLNLFIKKRLNQNARAKAYAGELGTPDTSLYYTAADLYRMAEGYGPQGRTAYIRARFTFDVAWPLVYLAFLVTALSWLINRAKLGKTS